MGKKRTEEEETVREAFTGLFGGFGMMIIVFLIVHFVIGFPAFQ
ncbi:hypothetical protein [Alkalicoccus luteus]|nr:hypothetical protein [Alkalicoccus luteus]